jgi:hypothetical protein
MLTAEDRLDLMDVIARYNNASDDHAIESFLAEFTEDARFVGGISSEERGEPRFSYSVGGKDATAGGKEGLRQVLPGIFAGHGTRKRHLATNFVYRTLDQGRVAVDYVLFVLEAEASPRLVASAWVTSRFRREGGRWLVEEHAIDIDPSLKAAAQG